MLFVMKLMVNVTVIWYYPTIRKNEAVWRIFVSLIVVLNKVYDFWTVIDIEFIINQRKIMESFKLFVIKEFYNDSSIIDNGEIKFVLIRK